MTTYGITVYLTELHHHITVTGSNQWTFCKVWVLQ